MATYYGTPGNDSLTGGQEADTLYGYIFIAPDFQSVGNLRHKGCSQRLSRNQPKASFL
ncbi:hypothetical protein [Microcoleus sp. N3A4]|uniref:hypothetical protein n=1 Tax=Microcoleus sp. N3A4 TaxID=3055379 RepID=UPI00403F16ED